MSDARTYPRKVWCGKFKNPNVLPFWEQQMLFEQYQLIKTKGEIKDSLKLPVEHSHLLSLVLSAMDDFRRVYGGIEEHYTYLTVKRGYHSNLNPQNREGWHIDGYRTEDVNYILCDSHPTEYIDMKPPKSLEHGLCLEYLEKHSSQYQVKELEPFQLYDIGRVVHRVSRKDFDGVRTFIKISFSKNPYSHLGNKINNEFIKEYRSWNWQERKKERNCPNLG